MPQAIVVENVTKVYQLGEARPTMLREVLMGALGRLAGRTPAPSRSLKRALDGVSLEVEQGEVVGIIGRNGAGKSTLLKVLSRITYPTSGRVEVSGRVGSLLEVGTGFHDELTGRENIYLNGSILGMKKRETDAALDRIIEFADVTEFLDTPIKRYSSGMRMRLGFAVAAHLSTDVLFVDEVLAVGDVGFQKKCLGAMRELEGVGRTIIFVSHNMAAVENLCKRTIWISDGQVKQDGDTREVIRAYLNSFEATEQPVLDLATVHDRTGTGDVRFVKLEFLGESDGEQRVVYCGGPLNVRLHYECQRDVPNLYFGLRIFSNLGVLISDLHNWATNQGVPLAHKGTGSIDLNVDYLNLMPGTYYVGLWAATNCEYHDLLENVAKIDVHQSDFYGTGRGLDSFGGLILFPYRWKVPENAVAGSAERSAAPTPQPVDQPGADQRELANYGGCASISPRG
jgi:lipopolysaccharide transport system ATP-binding protein